MAADTTLDTWSWRLVPASWPWSPRRQPIAGGGKDNGASAKPRVEGRLFQLIEEGFVRRAFLFVVVVLVVGIAGLGFYRGWFQLSSDTDQADHKVNTTFTVDEDKIREDKEKVQEFGHQAKGKTGTAID